MKKDRLIDLTGKVFSYWTVVSFAGYNDKHYYAEWLCRCKCGVEKIVCGSNLRKGVSKSCGCLRSELYSVRKRVIGLDGMVFGRLRVIDRGPNGPRGETQWNCVCICGNSCVVAGTRLKAGKSQSCGCLAKDINSLRRGSKSATWKGGKFTTKEGYVKVLHPEHSNANSHGYVLEHIYVMSEYIGRPLTKDETVHHKNGVKNKNNIENLELWVSKHPSGQRVTDLVLFAREILSKYESTALK